MINPNLITGTNIFQNIFVPEEAVFWDDMPCGSWKNRHFRQTYRLSELGTTPAVTSQLEHAAEKY
jgi:hypothetical protein